jgi:large subunit ribosomal protein L15
MSMHNHTLRSPRGAKKNRKRVGRGDSSGNGSYSGKGMKGQKSRSGGGVRPGFEGGQLPLIKRLPSLRGFNNIFKTHFTVINLGEIVEYFPEGGDVTPQILQEKGLIDNPALPLKILGNGNVDVPLNVVAQKFSASATLKLEKAGGSAQVIG